MSILVVEDEGIIRRLTSRVLRSEGYDVLEATDGVDAIKVWLCYHALIDLLVTDIHMPHMNGHELSRWFRNQTPDIPIVVVSSDKERDFPPLTVHYSAILLKPVRHKILIETVGGLLEGCTVLKATHSSAAPKLKSRGN
jgi:CheY-like chemotaxis protein